jgi:hypothetical protein
MTLQMRFHRSCYVLLIPWSSLIASQDRLSIRTE